VRLYKDLLDERGAWHQRIAATLFHSGCASVPRAIDARLGSRKVPVCSQGSVVSWLRVALRCRAGRG
jgi:hypothetical protein